MAGMEEFAQRLAQGEDALELLNSFLTHAPFGIAVYRSDGSLDAVNEAYRRLFGGDPAPGHNIFREAQAGSLDLWRVARRAFAGEVVKLPARWHAATSSSAEVAVETTLIPLTDKQGGVPHVVVMYTDVTPHLKAQAEKEFTLTRQQVMLERMPVGVIINNQDHVYTYWNPAAELIFGYTRAEMIGKHPLAISAPESHQPLLALLERIKNGEMEAHGSITTNITKDGRRIFCEWHNTPLFDADGKFTGKVSMVQDVTDRIHADAAVRASETRLRTILERSPVGIIVNDVDFRYTYWNPAAERIFGWSSEYALGKLPTDLTVPPDRRADADVWMARLRTGNMEAHDINENVTKDGRRILCEWHNTPLFDAGGGFAGKLSMVQDVTERVSAEAIVAESREQLETTLRSIGDAVIATDAAGRVELMNPVAERLTGWRVTEALGKPLGEVFNIVSEETRATVESPVSRVLREKKVIGLANHTALIARDGTERPIADSGAPISDAAGRIQGVVLVFRDQTEERAAQAAVAASEAQYRGIVENSFEGIWTLDAANRITFMNPRMAQLLGGSPDLFVGRSIFDLLHPEDTKDAEGRLAQRRAGVAGVHDRRFRKVNGAYIWCQVSAFPRLDDAGTCLGITSMAMDVTERHQAQAELAESETRYRRIVENSFEGIWTLGGNDRVSFVNGRMAAMLGGTADQILGRHILDFIHEEDHADALGKMSERRAGKAALHDRRFRTLSGGSIWCQVSAVPMFDEKRKYLGVMNLVVDVTDRRSLEQQFLQAQKMEAVGRLAGGVAHDFNNLLTVILGYATILLKPDRQRSAAGARGTDPQGGRPRATLTRQLLAFSRQQVLQPQVLDLNAVVTDMEQMLRRLIGEDIELVLHMRLAAPGMVKADPGQIEQVLMNLAVNARDAMPRRRPADDRDRANVDSTSYARGRIGRDARPLRDARGQRHRHRHGRGDAGAHLRAVLHHQGAGQGHRPRALARSTASSSRAAGTSWVYSEPGHGTTFKIYLPRDRDAPGQTPSAGAAAHRARGTRDGPAGGGRGRGARGWCSEILDDGGYSGARGARTPARRCDVARSTPGTDPPAADRRGDARDERPRAGGALARAARR